MTKTFLTLLSFTLLIALAAQADVLNREFTSVSSATITNSTGLGCSSGPNYYISVSDLSGNVYQYGTGYTYTKDYSTYDVTVNFTSTFSGFVTLVGCFDYLTTASTDFQVAASSISGADTLTVCPYCDSATGTAAVRDTGGYEYVMNWSGSMSFFEVSGYSGTFYIYIDKANNNNLTYCASGSSLGSRAGQSLSYGNNTHGQVITYGCSGFPASNYVPLATYTYGNGTSNVLTDMRPTEFQ